MATRLTRFARNKLCLSYFLVPSFLDSSSSNQNVGLILACRFMGTQQKPNLFIPRGSAMAALARVPARCAPRLECSRRRAVSRSLVSRRGAESPCAVSAEVSVSGISEPSPSSKHEIRCRVYIEHTDAYQVVYHANYFKFMSREREAFLWNRESCEGEGGEEEGDRNVNDDSDKSWQKTLHTAPVIAIDECKFASPAVLGDDVLVITELRSIDSTQNGLTFHQEVIDAGSGQLRLSAVVTVAPVDVDGEAIDVSKEFCKMAEEHNVAITADDEGIQGLLPSDVGQRTFTTPIVCFREEFSRGEFCVCESDVLRFFERNRTEAIGGSDALNALKEQGTIVVVSRMNELRIAPEGMRELMGDIDGRLNTHTRMRTIYSVSTTSVKRRGLQITFFHELVVGDLDDEKVKHAKVVTSAEVTCTCLSRDSGRPMRCPPELAAKFT